MTLRTHLAHLTRRGALARGLAAALLPLSAAAQDKFIVMSSTTSTEQSGLFGHLLPIFKKTSGIDIRVVAQGTGQALDMGRRGDADVLFVHDQVAEEKFVADGFGLERRPVMYNDFVVIGPKADPAGVKRFEVMYNDFVIVGPKSDPASQGARQGRDRGAEEDRRRGRPLRLARGGRATSGGRLEPPGCFPGRRTPAQGCIHTTAGRADAPSSEPS